MPGIEEYLQTQLGRMEDKIDSLSDRTGKIEQKLNNGLSEKVTYIFEEIKEHHERLEEQDAKDRDNEARIEALEAEHKRKMEVRRKVWHAVKVVVTTLLTAGILTVAIIQAV